MGLLQQACRTYDCQRNLVGTYREGHPVLVPIAHTIKKIDIVITIDAEGNFISAVKFGSKEKKVAVSSTPESEARTTTKSVAYPLCDQVCYIANLDSEEFEKEFDLNDSQNLEKFKERLRKNFDSYSSQLDEWVNSKYSHPKIEAVYTYINKRRVISDLKRCNVLKPDKHGRLLNRNNLKLFVAWDVLGLGEKSGPCWSDHEFMDSFCAFYHSKKDSQNDEDPNEDVCMVLGGKKHIVGNRRCPKIVGNAKLISSNDDKNFTYRGRFLESREALTVSWEASQKAHNVLKWLMEDQRVTENVSGRIYLCWNPEGKKIPQAINPLIPYAVENKIEPSDYKERLYGTITGFKKKGELTEKDIAIIVSFDRTTENTGRLSITYYNEVAVSRFLDRLLQWDERCCMYDYRRGVSIPSLQQIVRCAYGTERLEVDDRMMKQGISRLLFCRIEGSPFPTDIEKLLVNRASTPTAYDKAWNQVILTACAVIRKYHFDHKREDYEMALEPKKKDRSYQYGRLLAVLEKAEQDALHSRGENRKTNAIKLWSVFSKRPEYASHIIMDQLKNAYYDKLVFYEKEIGSIMEELSGFSATELKKALDDTYLLGYYLEKNYLYTPKNSETEKEED